MSKFAFFDVDNTIYNGYSTSDFYFFLMNQGIAGNWVKSDDQRIGKQFSSGKIDYSEASRQVVTLQARALRGVNVSKIKHYQRQFMSLKQRLFPWVKEVFDLLENSNFQIHLISAAAQPSIQAIANYLGTDKFYTSELEIENDTFTGEVKHMLNNEAKTKAIHQVLAKSKIKSLTFGFGDSTGDIDMLSNTDESFVINPHQEELIEFAEKNGWHLVTNDTITSKINAVLRNENNSPSNS